MFYVKKYIYAIVPLMLITCVYNLTAMKKISDHGIKITKHLIGAEDIVVPQSMYVFEIPDLNTCKNTMCNFPKAVVLDKKTVVCTPSFNTISIVNIETGKEEYGFSYNSNISALVKINQTAFALGYENGSISVNPVEPNSKMSILKKANYQEEAREIVGLLKVSANGLISSDVKGNVNVWDLEKSIYTKKFENSSFLQRCPRLACIDGTEIIGGNVLGCISLYASQKMSNLPSPINMQAPISSILGTVDRKIIVGFFGGITGCFDFNSLKFVKFEYENSSEDLGPVVNILQLPGGNIVSCTNDGVILIRQSKEPYALIQEINGSKFLEKLDDEIVAFAYEEEEKQLLAITGKGYIISCRCGDKALKKNDDVNLLDNKFENFK